MKYIHNLVGNVDTSEPRARKLYLHLKKIESQMTLYEFSKWIDEIDYDFIDNIYDYIAPNEYYTYTNFHPHIAAFDNIRTTFPPLIESLKASYENLLNELNIQFTALRLYCQTIIEQYIFDMFTLNDIEFTSGTYNTKPVYVTALIQSTSHSTDPVSNDTMNNSYLIFVPEVEYSNNQYTIKSLSKLAEYAFFNGNDLNVTLNVLDDSLTSIGTINTSLTFSKISSSADILDSFNQISNIENLRIDIMNIHESFTVENQVIVDKRFADLNYELYIQNKYKKI